MSVFFRNGPTKYSLSRCNYDLYERLDLNLSDKPKVYLRIFLFVIATLIFLVDPWLTEKRVDRKKMTVDRNFFF